MGPCSVGALHAHDKLRLAEAQVPPRYARIHGYAHIEVFWSRACLRCSTLKLRADLAFTVSRLGTKAFPDSAQAHRAWHTRQSSVSTQRHHHRGQRRASGLGTFRMIAACNAVKTRSRSSSAHSRDVRPNDSDGRMTNADGKDCMQRVTPRTGTGE